MELEKINPPAPKGNISGLILQNNPKSVLLEDFKRKKA